MKFLINSLIVVILLTFTACSGGSGGGSSGGEPTVSSVKITPQSVLFTDLNQSKMLSAKAYDASGKELNVDINWSSSHDNIINITMDGNATAQGVIGSATITAEVSGVKSAPIMITVAEVVGGTIIVNDSQVVGNIEFLDPNTVAKVGVQYKVTLSGVALPDSGDIIVGTGEIPIGGQVVSATQNGANVDVLLEVVPIDQLFTQLEIHEDVDLSQVKPIINDKLSPYYTMKKQPNGSYLFTLKDQSSKASPMLNSEIVPLATPQRLGPFECSYEAGVLPISLALPASHQISSNLHTALDFSLGLSKMKAFV